MEGYHLTATSENVVNHAKPKHTPTHMVGLIPHDTMYINPFYTICVHLLAPISGEHMDLLTAPTGRSKLGTEQSWFDDELLVLSNVGIAMSLAPPMKLMVGIPPINMVIRGMVYYCWLYQHH